ncbi:MAG: cyclase family protein [Bacteroidota bacterium]|nr:cyclase family protein [Bacteroidota bacterium]
MYIDLTQTFTDSMPVYPGDEQSHLTHVNFFESDKYNNYKIISGMHVGTHIDGPMHLTNSPLFLSDINLDSFIGKGCLIDVAGQKKIRWDESYNQIIQEGFIVLIYTGHSRHFGSPEYLKDYPDMDPAFAEKLIDLKVKMVGIDTLSPDFAPHEIHKMLLSNHILIAENLTNLEKLINIQSFEVIALPLKVKADSGPARIIARVLS